MENQLQIFNNPQFGEIRVDRTTDDPFFCAADVTKALGYANGRDAVLKHCDSDDVAKHDTIDKLGRTQQVTFINESGVYALIFGSKLESARQFKHWVTSEVLPSIRKTGSYSIANLSHKELALMVIQAEEEKERLMMGSFQPNPSKTTSEESSKQTSSKDQDKPKDYNKQSIHVFQSLVFQYQK